MCFDDHEYCDDCGGHEWTCWCGGPEWDSLRLPQFSPIACTCRDKVAEAVARSREQEE